MPATVAWSFRSDFETLPQAGFLFFLSTPAFSLRLRNHLELVGRGHGRIRMAQPRRYPGDSFGTTFEGRESESAAVTRRKLGELAWLLDSSIRIPGTRFTIGLEALIGLVPGIGDLVGVALSSYILSEASRIGAPRSVLLRMASNIALEGLIGIVPLAGDVFDAAFKANQRNVRLLEAWLDQPRKTERSTRAFGAILLLGVVGFLAVLVAGSYFLIRLILDSF